MANKVPRDRSVKANGAALKRLRKGKGWSVEDLAQKSDISERTIRTAELGGPLHVRTLDSIAKALGVLCDALIQGSTFFASEACHDARHQFSHFLEIVGQLIQPTSDFERVLLSFNLAANHTLSYCARVKSGADRNLETELQLSDLWLLVADPLSRMGFRQFQHKMILKSKYWACIDCWSDDDIKNAGIELVPLTKSAEAMFQQLSAKP